VTRSIKKRLAIAVGCALLVPIVAIGTLFAMREPPDGPRIEVAPGVVGVEAGGAYAWIVRTAKGAVLIDAGLDASGTAILAELKRAAVEPAQVHAVLVTHGHPDHYAAAPLFPQATIAIGSGDLTMLRGDTTHYATFGKIMAAVMPMPPAPHTVTALRGGEQLAFDGARFQVIATPGHSPGSVMFLYDTILFTGDSLMRKKDGLTIAPSLFSEDAATNRDSLRALEPIPFAIVADGHAGVARNAKTKLMRLLGADGYQGGSVR
jgi:hydroxyacylglutathione hydrolase